MLKTSHLSMIAIAATLLAANAANATSTKAEGSAWRDQNCMFRSGVVQKGGEATRTSIYMSDATAKYQWCSPTTRTQVSSNDEYYDQRIGNSGYRNNNLAPASGY